MKPILITICALVICATTKAQQPAPKNNDPNDDPGQKVMTAPNEATPHKPLLLSDTSKVFALVENPPMPQGGMQGFYTYLAKNIRYPATAWENRTQGKVFLSFIVERDGSLSDIRVLRGVSPDLDAEAVRVLKNCPKWAPGTQDGIAFNVAFTMPISFALQTK
jgi:protein TonB